MNLFDKAIEVLIKLILLGFSLLGLSSIGLLIFFEINDTFSEAKLNAEIDRECGGLTDVEYGQCWESFQLASSGVIVIYFFIFLFILIGAICGYKLYKSYYKKQSR